MRANKFRVVAKRCKPLYIFENKVILIYSKGYLYLLNDSNGAKEKICKLPMTFIVSVLCKFRIFERIFRLEPRIAVKLDTHNVIISYKGGIYRLNLIERKIFLEHKYRTGINNPLNICLIENIIKFPNCIAYGEYSANLNKEEVNIYTRGLNINDKWEKKYAFPKNTITHIHSIVPDAYRNVVLILTGDESKESGIWIAQNDFKEVFPLVLGSQQYRSCCAYPLENGILYATDTPLETNYIYLISKKGDDWVTEKIQEINGSCIYSKYWKNQFIFSTTVEPDTTIKGRHSLFTYKLGTGIKNKQVQIVAGNLSQGFECITGYTKDIFPMGLFQFGAVHFCSGGENDILYFYPVAVKRYDGKLIAWKGE